MESLEQQLLASWDAIGTLYLGEVVASLGRSTAEKQLPLLSSFFQRAAVLVWARFKTLMEAHTASVAALQPKAAPEVTPHFVARRYAEFLSSLRSLHPPAEASQPLNVSLRALRHEVERLLQERLARLH
jgi:hypothetical protein